MARNTASTWAGILFACSLGGAITPTHAGDTNLPGPESKAASTRSEKTDNPKGKESKLIEGIRKLDSSLSGPTLELINEIIQQTRTDQSVIYLFTKTLDQYAERTNDNAFINEVRKQTKKLQDASYSDALIQNSNLSNQIKTRIESITLDAAKIACNREDASTRETQTKANQNSEENSTAKQIKCEKSSEFAKKRFTDELDTFSTRFLQSKKFRLGVGAEYLYLPQLSYPSAPSIDLTEFQAISTSQFGGSAHAIGLMDFSNRSVRAFRLSAKVPEGQLDVSIPSKSQTNTLITNVNRVAISTTTTTPDLLTRTTIESALKPEYDASVTTTLTGIRVIWKELKNILSTESGDNDIPRLGRSWEVAFGLGTTGFKVNETATTDVRLRADSSKTFADLASSNSVNSKKSFVFRADYLKLDFSLQISDELNVGLATRFYRKTNIDAGPVNIRGAAISMYAVWYPTFGW